MSIRIRVNVDDVDGKIEQYGVGAELVWGRDNLSAAGAFTDATGDELLVSGQTAYDIDDTTGQPGHWYRTRICNTAGTDCSAWSDVFQAGQLLAYATVVDLREEVRLYDDSKDNLLADLLRDASGWIEDLCGRDFYRHPQVSGTEIRYYNVTDGSLIVDDIVSLTEVAYAGFTGDAYTALTGTDWALGPIGQTPFGYLSLTDTGTLGSFYSGFATVRLTGVFGFASVPRLIRRATLDVARELYQQSANGKPVGMEYGRIPPSAVTAKEKYLRRTYAHV